MKIKQLIKKADIAVIAVIILLAIIFIVPAKDSDNITAEIIVDGSIVHSINLNTVNEEYTLELGNGLTVFTEKNGISVIFSDCRGKNCISCGKLTEAGDTAVCIPNKTVIRLTGEKKNAPDAVTY